MSKNVSYMWFIQVVRAIRIAFAYARSMFCWLGSPSSIVRLLAMLLKDELAMLHMSHSLGGMNNPYVYVHKQSIGS